jgi:hypothetical protein
VAERPNLPPNDVPALLQAYALLTPVASSGSILVMNKLTADYVAHKFELAIAGVVLQASYDLRAHGEYEMANRVYNLYVSGRYTEAEKLIRSRFQK